MSENATEKAKRFAVYRLTEIKRWCIRDAKAEFPDWCFELDHDCECACRLLNAGHAALNAKAKPTPELPRIDVPAVRLSPEEFVAVSEIALAWLGSREAVIATRIVMSQLKQYTELLGIPTEAK